jgi:hypothetical protein
METRFVMSDQVTPQTRDEAVKLSSCPVLLGRRFGLRRSIRDMRGITFEMLAKASNLL